MEDVGRWLLVKALWLTYSGGPIEVGLAMFVVSDEIPMFSSCLDISRIDNPSISFEAPYDKIKISDRINGVFWSASGCGHILHAKNLEPKVQPGCRSVPKARGTSISFELKSLVVLVEGSYTMVVHLPAVRRLSLKALRLFLGVKNVALAPRDILPMPPGRISALLEPFGSMQNVVCKHLFDIPVLTTNDSTIDGFLAFPPDILLALELGQVANVSVSSALNTEYRGEEFCTAYCRNRLS